LRLRVSVPVPGVLAAGRAVLCALGMSDQWGRRPRGAGAGGGAVRIPGVRIGMFQLL
jgi:hypothetical protein